MRDLIDMWGNTRMVVLTAISASLYAAILIPFKVLPIIPGVTEFRPANAVPVICSFLFGPAGAWGAAIGNVIGDFFGGLGPGDIFGFFGNLLYGLLPYKLWHAITPRDPIPQTIPQWIGLIAVILIASGGCALVVGWGLNGLGFVPFSVLANIVVLNNFVVAAALAPPLLKVIYPRVRKGQLLYRDLQPVAADGPRGWPRTGVCLVSLAIVGGLLVGNLISLDIVQIPAAAWMPATLNRSFEVSIGVLPFLALLFAGLWLLPS